MIFAKIFVFVLLVLSSISTSESRHRHHRCKHQPHTSCSCSSKRLNSNNPNTNVEDIETHPEINTELQLNTEKIDETKLPVNKDENLQTDNKEDKISRGQEILTPLNLQVPYFGELENKLADISPEQGSAMLKQYWVTRHIGDTQNFDSDYDQNNIKYPTNQINNIPSDLQATLYDQKYYQTKKNMFMDNINDSNKENKIKINNRRRYGINSGPSIDDPSIFEDIYHNYRVKPINLSDLSLYPKAATPGIFKNNIPHDYNLNIMPVQTPRNSQSIPQVKKAYNLMVQHDISSPENYPTYVKLAPSQMFDFHTPLSALKNVPSTEVEQSIGDELIRSDYVSLENVGRNIINTKNDPKSHETHYRVPATFPHRLQSSQHEPEKYSKWIKEQIVLLNNKSHGTGNLDLSGLGYSILQVLSENHMYLTDNGMIIGNDGTISNIHSLTLTPVIIGNTINLRNLLQRKYGMPSDYNNSHLQAILVSATHPLKILGVLPLRTTNQPLSTLNNLTTTTQRRAPKQLNKDKEDGADDPVEAKNMQDIIEEIQLKKLAPLSNINVNGNENSVSFGRTRSFNRREINPQHGKAFNLVQDQSNTGKLFIPDIVLHEESILPKDYSRLNSLDEKYLILDGVSLDALPHINIPIGSKAFDIAFRNEESPANRKNKLITATKPTSQSLFSTLEKVVHPTKEAILNILTKEMPVSMDRNMISTSSLQIPVPKLPVYYQTLPIEYDVVSNVQDIPNVISHDRDYGYISRSGDDEPTIPDIPPSTNNNSNGNHAVEIAENNDDDGDGDFRIIGGNAATGSGTPLSNKGRSGFMF